VLFLSDRHWLQCCAGGILGLAELAAVLRQVAQENSSGGDGLVRQVGDISTAPWRHISPKTAAPPTMGVNPSEIPQQHKLGAQHIVPTSVRLSTLHWCESHNQWRQLACFQTQEHDLPRSMAVAAE
jgi:hypothetical protein